MSVIVPSTNISQIKSILQRIFGELEDGVINHLLEESNCLELNSGENLFQQGDKENSLYIVLAGRCRALILNDAGNLHSLGDIGVGEPIGEFALFLGEPRSATIVAIRKSVVLQISEKTYLRLVALHPQFSTQLTRFVVKRLRRNALQQHLEIAAKNIAVINLQAENDISEYTDAVKQQFESQDVPFQILDAETPQKHQDLHSLFNSLEQSEGLNFLVCNEQDINWSRQCIIYADLIILATDFYSDPSLKEIERQLQLYSQDILNKKIYLLLLHPENGPAPQNTSRWLEHRAISLHIHYRKNHLPDIRRFTRIISNRAIGLVLGGGGTKGFAHFGVLRALAEAGIEVDFLGGTSAGAIYGLAGSFCDFNQDKIDHFCKEGARAKVIERDLTIPFISIMSGKKVRKYLQYIMGNTHLEDFWVNSFCVSTNYSTASSHMHKRGLAWKQILASMAIPGIFPPVVINNQLHVDGAVVDNLPIESMYEFPVKHVIAISLSKLKSRNVDFENMPSAGALFWQKITGRKRYRVPDIGSILINSLTLNSRQKQEIRKSGVDLYVEMDLKGEGMLDGKRWKEIMQKGYDQMKQALNNHPKEQQFWLEVMR